MTTAIILAGGLGTRLRTVVPDLPKPMAPINGRPFLEHQLDYWIAQGVTRFVLSVGYRHDMIVSHFGNAYRGASLDYAVEQSPLGTGGGLLMAMERLDGDAAFLLLNGDTYFEVDLVALHDFHASKQADWTFALFRTTESGRYMGMNMSACGRVLSLSSDSGEQNRLANGGVYLVKPQSVRECQWHAGDNVSLENDILRAAIESGRRLFGLECGGNFIDIGVPDDYARASSLLTG